MARHVWYAEYAPALTLQRQAGFLELPLALRRHPLVRRCRLQRDPKSLDGNRVAVRVEANPDNTDTRVVAAGHEPREQVEFAIRDPNRGRVQDAFDLVRVAASGSMMTPSRRSSNGSGLVLAGFARSLLLRQAHSYEAVPTNGPDSSNRRSRGRVNRVQCRMCRHCSISLQIASAKATSCVRFIAFVSIRYQVQRPAHLT